MYFTKRYTQIITQNFHTANVCSVRWNKQTAMNFQLKAAGIEHDTPVPSQFLYLLLLTRTTPFLARKYKYRATKHFRFGEAKRDTAKMIAYPNQARLTRIFNKFM